MDVSLVEVLTQELRRGTLTLCVLGALKEPLYGYLLQQRLADAGISIEQNTLYPLLRRLEKQDLLESNWNLEEAHPRRYYRINNLGEQLLVELIEAWNKMNEAVNALIRKEDAT